MLFMVSGTTPSNHRNTLKSQIIDGRNLSNENLLETNGYCLLANVNPIATNGYCLAANVNPIVNPISLSIICVKLISVIRQF